MSEKNRMKKIRHSIPSLLYFLVARTWRPLENTNSVQTMVNEPSSKGWEWYPYMKHKFITVWMTLLGDDKFCNPYLNDTLVSTVYRTSDGTKISAYSTSWDKIKMKTNSACCRAYRPTEITGMPHEELIVSWMMERFTLEKGPRTLKKSSLPVCWGKYRASSAGKYSIIKRLRRYFCAKTSVHWQWNHIISFINQNDRTHAAEVWKTVRMTNRLISLRYIHAQEEEKALAWENQISITSQVNLPTPKASTNCICRLALWQIRLLHWYIISGWSGTRHVTRYWS